VDAAWERAVTGGDPAEVRRLLAAGAHVNSRDRYGQTALMLAAHRGGLGIVEALVQAGADLNATAKYNLSALMLAIVAGHDAVALALIRAGADRAIRGTGAPGFASKTAHDLALARHMHAITAALTSE
jgi:ankyrin repeat protein